jgi:transposase
MQAVKTIGLDIAKSIFQVHGVNADGQVVIRRKLKRRYVLAFFEKLPTCLIGMEACATSHHWSRELQARQRTRYIANLGQTRSQAHAIFDRLRRALRHIREHRMTGVSQ